MNRLIRRVLLPVAMPLLMLTTGCSDAEVPTASSPAPISSLTSAGASGPDVSVLARFSSSRSITIAWAKKWIGPEGGRLEFHGFAIDVPAGAVDRVTQFSIHLPVDPSTSDRVLAKFGPHGAQFAKPVSIELPYAGTSIFGSSSATVVWWNPDAALWEDMGGQATSDGQRLRTQTSHFSEYGTTEERGGGITLSGG